MSLQTAIDTDLQTIHRDLGSPTVSWNGEDYDCVASPAGETAVLDDGGFAIQADIIIVIRRALFTDNNLPQKQQKVTFQGETYRILRVSLEPTQAMVRLTCAAPTRGI